MTDRELMQQALEVLNHVNVQDRVQIIIALRERLALPEMQPCAGRNCGSTNPNLHSAECFEDYEKSTGMATKPVAWWNPKKDTVSCDPVHRHHPDCVSLYTAQPPRQPLTVEQIIAIIHPIVMADMPDEMTDYEIARAIEAAHGIKGEA